MDYNNCKNVCAIIVTFNRKKDLQRCIKRVMGQTRKVQNLLIIDNASTDSTFRELQDNGYIDKTAAEITDQLLMGNKINDTQFWIMRKSSNTGGSGGFYSGLKYGNESISADYFWLMDDDGYPGPDCLHSLLQYSDKFDYIMPASIDIENHHKLSWEVRKKNGKKTILYKELCRSWGVIMEYVTPFNGILLSKKCVDDVGYINPDFFLWGDEYDHYWRCKEKGYQPVTLLKAKFYHPAQKLPLVPIMSGLIRVPYVESKLRMVCLARNYTYIYWHYRQKYKIPLKFITYAWLFLITRHMDIEGMRLYCNSVIDGFKGDFTRHLKYL